MAKRVLHFHLINLIHYDFFLAPYTPPYIGECKCSKRFGTNTVARVVSVSCGEIQALPHGAVVAQQLRHRTCDRRIAGLNPGSPVAPLRYPEHGTVPTHCSLCTVVTAAPCSPVCDWLNTEVKSRCVLYDRNAKGQSL